MARVIHTYKNPKATKEQALEAFDTVAQHYKILSESNIGNKQKEKNLNFHKQIIIMKKI